METLSIQDVVEFSIKQTEAEKLKELISARHIESLDTSKLIDAQPILDAMLVKYAA